MQERHALITGGEGDLAKAMASSLKASGYVVHAPGRDEMDVCDEDAVRSYIGALPVPGLDLLVHNAGNRGEGLCLKLSSEDWEKTMAVHLKGAWCCAKAAMRGMAKERRGHIVLLGSFSGLVGAAGQSAYAAAKSGLVGLGTSLARELGNRNVRVNTVLPGFLETKMTADLSQEVVARFREEQVLGRFNTPEEAAKFVAFLDSMPHVSGQVFSLDSRIRSWT